MNRNIQRGQGGFSLIEIMVVVIIIGLLASIVAPAVLDRADEARIQKVHADFKAIQTALKLYRIDNYTYPTTEQGLEALVNKPTMAPEPRNWKQSGYLDELPQDPWGSPYQYLSPGETREYDIYTLGADGISGGEDQNADISVWDESAQGN
ncbi:type II secretion system major pseudopilin GspG [Marinimicrobium agarilyticum]|uniref:type II secretion system major pseudopilin GspG n=1 Tax=Marinimicrobium agarilyticum TaxID=306546 RepID=UPI00041BEBE4|nr:type II secretion system major pseudopilin GspG [Marinimicrobium agarilyticum]